MVAFASLGRSEVNEPTPAPAPATEPAPAPEVAAPAAESPPAPVAEPSTAQVAEPSAATDATAAPGITKSPESNGRLSVDFPDEDVRNILRNVADLFELNLVIPETLQGKASIKLRNVTWRQIFQKVLTPLGYGFVEEDNVITVVTLDEVNEQQESIIIPITSGNLGEAKMAASSVVSRERDLGNGKKIAGGTVIELPAASALQVTDTVPKLAAVRETLSRLSKANSATNTRQVLIETKFYDVTDGNTRNLGVSFSKLAHIQGGTVGLSQGLFSTTGFPVGLPDKFSSAIYDSKAFAGAIDALQSDDKVKLVTNPMIVTQQNHKAEIFEKTTLRYFVPVPQAQGAVPSPPEIKEIEVKTGLTVTPSIIDTRDANGDVTDSLIQMLVVPEVSSLGQDDVYTEAGVSITIPRVNTRTTTTNVVLKNGYTLVLGGLVKTQINKSKTKTPFLGDIPGLGLLFRRTMDSIEQRTLLTFITARIITPDGSPPEAEKNGNRADFAKPALGILTSQQVRDLAITKQDLPGYIEPNGSHLPEGAPADPVGTKLPDQVGTKTK
jgi:type IV pilus assembly protein PilQ